MAIEILAGGTSPGLKIGGTDLSDHVRQIEVQMNYADVDTTAMGAVSQTHSPGLRDDRVIVQFFQDYQASKVDATISGLAGSTTGATIQVFAHGVTAASTAPSYTFVGSPFEYSPINGEVGNANETTVTFLPVAGSYITRATA
jgi:hypothetical protein